MRNTKNRQTGTVRIFGHEFDITVTLGSSSMIEIECPTLGIDESVYLGYVELP